MRAEPPQVVPPKDLQRRLGEAGELGWDELPDGVESERLARSWHAYQERPARPVLQVLAEPGRQRLVLLGDPGSGKSTLARYLALALADGFQTGPLAALTGWLPVLVELRTYADARWRDRTFLDLIDHLHATQGLGLPGSMLDTFLRQDGRAVVIFDGLGELFDPQLRETVVHQRGWRDDAGTLPLLRELAITDPDGEMREAAVQALALGWSDDPGTLPLLRELAVTDPDEGVQEVALQGLAAQWGAAAQRRAVVSAGDDGMLEPS